MPRCTKNVLSFWQAFLFYTLHGHKLRFCFVRFVATENAETFEKTLKNSFFLCALWRIKSAIYARV